ncbi:hypothetical protein CTAYLR_009070 [Chrysophaeum taylorii]|uniref:UBC core domain-containing protein n=1 Tax=Chrysophaeum taylorii TaxID=2483200 RepID=A0AAD7UM02_9STRA|nr:hypothetical protein CTAYLR_009070 [Chrysophaeum taylorii]
MAATTTRKKSKKKKKLQQPVLRKRCASCGAERTDDECNKDLKWQGAAACEKCIAKWEAPAADPLARGVDLVENYRAASKLGAVVASLDLEQEQWKRVGEALCARAERQVSRMESLASLGKNENELDVYFSGLIDDARLCRLLRRDLHGDDLVCVRRWVRRIPAGAGLYAALAVAEARAEGLKRKPERSVAAPVVAETRPPPETTSMLGLVMCAVTMRVAFFDFDSARAVALASKPGQSLLDRAVLWGTVALARFPHLKSRDSALDWRTAFHFERLKSTTRPREADVPSRPTPLCSSRLMREAREMLSRPPAGVSASPLSENDLLTWRGTLDGPDDSPWSGGRFRLHIAFPHNYPHAPPDVYFLTPVFHPNVDFSTGRICVDLLEDSHWSSAASVRVVLLSLQSLLTSPTADDTNNPANLEAARALRCDRPLFMRRARESVDASRAFFSSNTTKAHSGGHHHHHIDDDDDDDDNYDDDDVADY